MHSTCSAAAHFFSKVVSILATAGVLNHIIDVSHLATILSALTAVLKF